MGTGIRRGKGEGRGGGQEKVTQRRERQREKFIMYNKTKGVMGNNSDIKIRVRWDLYEKCRFENVNDDEGEEGRYGIVIVVWK